MTDVSKDLKTSKPQSHTKDLLLLLAVPLGIVLIAAAVVYLPRLAAKPAYDFLYSYCPSYDCADSYSVGADGKLIRTSDREDIPAYQSYRPEPSRLGYYDASEDSSRTIIYEETGNLSLLGSDKSPDGYTFLRQSSGSSFLFWGDSQDGWVLKNGLKKKTVSLYGTEPYYSSNFTFIGWVK